jgi:Ca2+/Na+ antiporter
MNWFTSLVSAVAVLIVVLTGLLYMFSPPIARIMLKRVGPALLVIVSIPMLVHLFRQLLGSWWFLLILLTLSVTAFAIREWRLGHERKQQSHSVGKERIPMMPSDSVGDRE